MRELGMFGEGATRGIPHSGRRSLCGNTPCTCAVQVEIRPSRSGVFNALRQVFRDVRQVWRGVEQGFYIPQEKRAYLRNCSPFVVIHIKDDTIWEEAKGLV